MNVTVAKHLTRFLSAVTLGSAALSRWQPDAVLVHGVHSPYLLAGPLLSACARCPRRHDPDRPTRGGPTLRWPRGRLAQEARPGRGALAVVDTTASSPSPPPWPRVLAAGKPALVMEGILAALPPLLAQPATATAERPTTVVYAGGLSRAYGVDRLLEAVQSLSGRTSGCAYLVAASSRTRFTAQRPRTAESTHRGWSTGPRFSRLTPRPTFSSSRDRWTRDSYATRSPPSSLSTWPQDAGGHDPAAGDPRRLRGPCGLGGER